MLRLIHKLRNQNALLCASTSRSLVAVCAMSAALAGCVTAEAPINAPPVVAEVSKSNNALRNLPPPTKKTLVAVYDLEDLTGQYKQAENIQTLSRAVTQGGSSILVTALEDVGERRWFTVLERKKLDNLLKERQIVTEMGRLYRNQTAIDPAVLPPLLNAPIIIEGAIVGYDTNVTTGGAGARILGIGGDTKYIQDVVTVSLRAVSTKTGEVLTSVTTRKAIASYSLQGGAVRYVKLNELLEAEAGVTYNEPKQIAVESAVEAAVYGLVVEGSKLGIWSFADKSAGDALVKTYEQELYGKRIPAVPQPAVPPVTKLPQDIPQTTPAPKAHASAANTGAVAPRAAQPAVTLPPPERQNEPAAG